MDRRVWNRNTSSLLHSESNNNNTGNNNNMWVWWRKGWWTLLAKVEWKLCNARLHVISFLLRFYSSLAHDHAIDPSNTTKALLHTGYLCTRNCTGIRNVLLGYLGCGYEDRSEDVCAFVWVRRFIHGTRNSWRPNGNILEPNLDLYWAIELIRP